jgi:signal transduction histidine kinase
MYMQSSDWVGRDDISREDADDYLRSSFTRAAMPFFKSLGLERGFFAVTGMKLGAFAPVISMGDIDDAFVEENIIDMTAMIDGSLQLPSHILRLGQRVFFPLIGFGELFGFIVVYDPNHKVMPADLEGQWDKVAEQIANANFARRVVALAAPLIPDLGRVDNVDDSAFLEQVVQTAGLSFGADGAIIRLFDPDINMLMVADQAGDAPDALLEDRRPGEGLSGSVLVSEKENWALVEFAAQTQVRGCPVSPNSVGILHENGVRAVLCARLDDPFPTSGSSPFGTLSYYFRRPNSFSWRDVALFVGFTRRVADLLGLVRQAKRLYEKSRILEIQAPVFTQAELAHLLVHDLSHKVLDIEGEGLELQDEVRKELRRHRDSISPDLNERFGTFANSIKLLKKEIIDLRAVGRLEDKNDEILRSTKFEASQPIKAVVNMMRSALDRQKVDPQIQVTGDTRLEGPVKVLEHILMNLIINTLDAAKTRATQRPMSIHFAATGDKGGIRFRVWDTGPGIDMSKFSNAEDVFKVGKTTKPRGTGMGLAVARTLLDRYFKGSIRLVDPKSAMFELSFPARR